MSATQTLTKEKKEDWKKSTISLKYPSYRNNRLVSTQSWLNGKRCDDEAEGLWRIHDNLYDLRAFIPQHPGGSFWLEQTRGTDITEAFEIHHIRSVPQALLDKYFVRKASKPRNYTLTFHENGFYRTLKRRVAEQLKYLDYSPARRTYYYHLGLVIAALLFAVISTQVNGWIFEFLTALFVVWQSVAAHNYFHQRDNWQMYTFNLTLMNFSSWRISHAMSHHIYTNSLQDMEMSLFEPHLCWVPNEHMASKAKRILMVVAQPLVYVGMVPVNFLQRVFGSLISKNELYWHDIIGFTLPLLMMVFSPDSPLEVLLKWTRIIIGSSFIFAFISINASHHPTENFHDGDIIMREDRDWGLYQLSTIVDRSDVKNQHFLALTHFGDHTLHHFFPTLDHGVLPQLYPIVMKTLEEFKGELREMNMLKQVIGQSRQLLRTKVNEFY